MSNTAIGTIAVMMLAILVLVTLAIVILRPKKQDKLEQTVENKKYEVDIDSLLHIVSDKQSSKNQIESALLTLASSLKFPPKNTSSKNEQEKYLNFILLLTAHKNADAGLITYMDKELKLKNPSYENEIDVYIKKGLDSRQ